MSLSTAHEKLKNFAKGRRGSGGGALILLAFDVSKAFDNVDVEQVKQLLRNLVRSHAWDLHKLHSTVQARGSLVTRFVSVAVGSRYCWTQLCIANRFWSQVFGVVF
jgi:hypothetical protein